MFLEFPEERRRTGKVVPEPAPLAQVPSPGTDIGLSTHIPRTEGIMFWLYRHLDKAGYWMTAGLRFGCEYPAYLAIRYGFIHVSWCMWRRGGRRESGDTDDKGMDVGWTKSMDKFESSALTGQALVRL